jgi:heptosyltransferase-2
MKIIINALSGIGDAVMFSPALKLLKEKLPLAEIEMMVMFNPVKDMYERNPAISKIHFIDFLNQPALKSFKQVLALRKNKYDASINVYPSNRREYNIISRLLGAKMRIGTKYNHYSFSNFDFMNNYSSREAKNKHNVVENFELVKFLIPDAKENELGSYEIFLNEDDNLFAANYIRKNKLQNFAIIGFHAGSATFKGHINKRWSADKFAELAESLNSNYGAKILLFGTEKDVNDNIYQKGIDFTLIPEEANIMQSIALVKKCSLFVSNDAAFMHIASAMQVPNAAIFGYTNPQELHPWKSKHIIVRKELECSPCFFNSPKPVNCIYNGEDEFKCIKTISVEEVFTACTKLIKEKPGNIKP